MGNFIISEDHYDTLFGYHQSDKDIKLYFGEEFELDNKFLQKDRDFLKVQFVVLVQQIVLAEEHHHVKLYFYQRWQQLHQQGTRQHLRRRPPLLRRRRQAPRGRLPRLQRSRPNHHHNLHRRRHHLRQHLLLPGLVPRPPNRRWLPLQHLLQPQQRPPHHLVTREVWKTVSDTEFHSSRQGTSAT